MIQLHVEAETFGELKIAAIKALDMIFVDENKPVYAGQENQKPAGILNMPKLTEAPAEMEKRKPGRPKKEAETTMPVNPLDVPAQTTPATAPATEGTPVTFDMMKAALQAIAAKDGEGMTKAVSILAKLGYERIKDVKVEDYPKVLEACK